MLRHAVVFIADGGAADAYGANNGHDPLAAVSGRSTVDSTSASTTRSSTSGGANGESSSVHPARPGSARRCAGGSGDLVGGQTSSWGSPARRAPAGGAAQAALLVAQAVPQDCAV